MPRGMQKRRIHIPPIARIIHQDHGDDGEAAEEVDGLNAVRQETGRQGTRGLVEKDGNAFLFLRLLVLSSS